jgi:hypothetical protein
MNAAGFARVRACFENGIEVLPVIVLESRTESLQGSSRGSLPQMPQMPQPPTPARREMTDEEAAFEERAAIIEYGGGFPRPLAEFLARRGSG